MKKLIIILSVIFIWGCEKDPISIPYLPQNPPDTSQWWNDEKEWAILIIGGDIVDTIEYIFSQFDDIYKDCDNNFTILDLGIEDYMDNRLQCYMPIDTIGIFNVSSFDKGNCNEGYFNYCYTLLPDTDLMNNNICFSSGSMSGEITKYGKVWDMVEGVVSGSLYNDYYNIDFELNFCMNREKDYYY